MALESRFGSPDTATRPYNPLDFLKELSNSHLDFFKDVTFKLPQVYNVATRKKNKKK